MEKKTRGAFIAVLRKENAMTQKELAERLHVSDKTVSRWERNDGTPDPAAILAMAEVFGVSCDELLRGEKHPIAKPAAQNEQTAPKHGEKNQQVLHSAFLHYKNATYIATGLSVLGLLVSFLFFFAGFNVALMFLSGSAFFTASIICQAVAANKALPAAEKTQQDDTRCNAYKQKVAGMKQKLVGLNTFFIFFTLSLIPLNAVFGIGTNILLFFFLDIALFLLPYVLVLHFHNKLLAKKGVIPLPQMSQSNRGPKKILLYSAILVLFVCAFLFYGYEIVRLFS